MSLGVVGRSKEETLELDLWDWGTPPNEKPKRDGGRWLVRGLCPAKRKLGIV